MRERTFVVIEWSYGDASVDVIGEGDLSQKLAAEDEPVGQLNNRYSVYECIGERLDVDDIRAILNRAKLAEAHHALGACISSTGNASEVMTAAVTEIDRLVAEVAELRVALEKAQEVARDEARRDLVVALAKVMP